MKLNYVMVPQRICDEAYTTKSNSLIAFLDVALRMKYITQLEFSDVELKARWGSAVYEIKPDGTLRMANHHFDTSG